MLPDGYYQVHEAFKSSAGLIERSAGSADATGVNADYKKDLSAPPFPTSVLLNLKGPAPPGAQRETTQPTVQNSPTFLMFYMLPYVPYASDKWSKIILQALLKRKWLYSGVG